jgi:YD repeat-containing protein
VNVESGTVNYTYDKLGNLLTKTDNRGIKSTYAYDVLDRMTGVSYFDGTPPVSYSYDAANVSNSKGHLTSVSNENSTTGYAGFDVMGNVLASTQQTAGQTYPFNYGYNLASAVTSETYPSGRVVTTGYDAANRPNAVSGTLAGQVKNYVASASYWITGASGIHANSMTFGNNLVSADWYDNRLRPYALLRRADNTQNSYLQGLQFTWNLNGTLGSVSEGNGNGLPYNSMQWVSQSYSYDNLNRLTGANDSGGWTRSFGYDSAGNMWLTANTGVSLAGNTPTSNVYNAANQISGGSYDGAGNQTVVNGNAVFYSAENRVVSVTVPQNLGGGTETIAYDGLGQRVQKTVPSGTAVYVYDAFGQLAAEYASAASASPCQTCYLSEDHLGSIRLGTDQNGKVVARHDYLPFGEEIPGGTAGRTSQFGSTTDTSEIHRADSGFGNRTGLFQCAVLQWSVGAVYESGSGECGGGYN